MNSSEDGRIARRGFLATSAAFAVLPRMWTAPTDGRFFSCNKDDGDVFFPIPLNRLVVLDDPSDFPTLASQIVEKYGELNYGHFLKPLSALKPDASCRAGYFVIQNCPLLRDWWLFGVRSEGSIRPIVMHFTSRSSLEECRITGLLVQRIAHRLHRQKQRIPQLATDPAQLLRLVNWEIIEAAKSLPE